MRASSSTRTVIAILAVLALAIAFWMLLLGPKREKSDELGLQAEQLQSKLAESESVVAAGEESRRDFPSNYQQLVVLGKAVPAGDESASLLIQLNHIADRSKLRFESLKVGTSDGSEATAAATPAPEAEGEGESEGEPAGEESASVPAAAVEPTETAASTLPIGATVGPAGLNVLPYDLTFSGSFFHVADFINGLDSLIHTENSKVAVDGRLVTVNGFALSGSPDGGFPKLEANFSVTTYLVPPNQGITAGASPTEPAEAGSSSTVSNLR